MIRLSQTPLWGCLLLLGCPQPGPHLSPERALRMEADGRRCLLVETGFGPEGEKQLQWETVADGLQVPWGLAFLGGDDLLVTERSGRILLVREGRLLPVADLTEVVDEGEGGLLDLVLHPRYPQDPSFYVYLTTADGNRVEHWRLHPDRQGADRVGVVLDGIPSARFHNGGRMGFGPDGMLYIATGDAQEPARSQDPSDPAGALLRVRPDGSIPRDNPFEGSPVFVSGVRNSQGFGWDRAGQLFLTDHGPTGEFGRQGHDAVFQVWAGADLGWPARHGCRVPEGSVRPLLTWREAVPPGGAAIYRGGAFAGWDGDLLIGALGAEHLHRVALDGSTGGVVGHEVYLQGELGRIRTVRVDTDGAIFVTTSNCDGRGTCPPEGDRIVRIVPQPRALRR